MTNISYSLICAVREGRLEEATKLINSFGLSYSQAWSEGYVLLRDAIEKKHTAISKLLLTKGSKVNSKTEKPSNTPLHFAATNGDIEIVKMLLDRGANINAKNKDGITPLYNAIENEKMEVIKLLSNRGANVNARDNYNNTPLHIAARRGYLQIVEHLLKHGAYVNSLCICTYTFKNNTPLYFAVENGHEKVVKLLLECGANVDAQDNVGKTILHFAVEKGHLVIIEHILKYCPDINNKSNRSSLNAAVYGYQKEYSKIVENLLQYGFTVNSEDINNCKLLHAAVEKGYLRIVEELLKYGADVNMLYDSIAGKGKGYTPLHTAIKNKQEEVAKLLISYKADVNAIDETGNTPIFYAIKNADLKITKLLLTNRANIKDNPKLLNIAVKEECKEIVEVLLQHGADINASDEYGRTALHFTACEDGDCFFPSIRRNKNSVKGEIAKLLLSRGANVNAQTKSNLTTLHAATQKGYVKVVEALLEHNADVNSVDKSDITPLHLSAKTGNEVISKMLLNKGANVNAKQKDRITALHIATLEGHTEVVELLLKYSAKVDFKFNKSDITLLHIAAQKSYLDIVEVLLKFGADIDSRDEYGRTALHIASKEGCIQTVIALLKHGSDINVINKNNDTPLDVAIDGISLFYNRNEVYNYDSDNDYDDFERDICACEQIAEIFKQHIIKMKTANLYVSKKNFLSMRKFELMSSNYRIRDFQDECEEEIAIMKSEKISNTNISFYDILTKGRNSLAIYMRNENIMQVFKSDNYKTKFPIYASMVENHLRKGMKRKELLEQGNKTFHFLFNNFSELPYHCIEKIFSYLSDEDLRILIDACKPSSVSNLNTDINNVEITSNISKVPCV